MPPILKAPRLSAPGDGSLSNRPVDFGEEPAPVPATGLDGAAASAPVRTPASSPGAGFQGVTPRRPRRKL